MKIENLLELPFDMYQRYKDIQIIVKKLFGNKKVRILDVGGENNLIRKFLPDVETYYINFRNESAPNFVRGDGVQLPFKDSVFDIVVTVDTLEHIKPKDREQFINELIRASKDYVIITAPFDNGLAPLVDRFLNEISIQFLKVEHPCIKEHIANGLPKIEEVTNILDKRKIEYISFSSGNIYNWLYMMTLKHYLFSIPNTEELHKLLDGLYNINFYELDHSPPSYRQVFILSKKGSNFEQVEKVFNENLPNKVKNDDILKFLNAMSVLSNIHVVNQLKEKEQQINLQQEHVVRLDGEIGQKDERIKDLEGEINKILQLKSIRLHRKIDEILRRMRII